MEQMVFNVLLAASLNLLAAVSFTFVYLPTRAFNIAHAAVSVIGGYACYFAFSRLSLPMPIAMLCAAITSGVVGALIEDAALRRLREQSRSTWVSLVASIALFTVGINLISLLFGDDVKVLGSGSVGSSQSWFGLFFTLPQMVMVAVCALVFTTASLFTQNSNFGRKLIGVAFNPDLAEIFGVHSRRVRLTAVAIGSALGGLTASLAAWDTGLHPGLGFRLLVAGIVTMIISGVGMLRWLLGGAFLLAVAQNAAAYFLDSKWMDAVAFFILIGFLIWKPLGFSGRRLKKVEV